MSHTEARNQRSLHISSRDCLRTVGNSCTVLLYRILCIEVLSQTRAPHTLAPGPIQRQMHAVCSRETARSNPARCLPPSSLSRRPSVPPFLRVSLRVPQILLSLPEDVDTGGSVRVSGTAQGQTTSSAANLNGSLGRRNKKRFTHRLPGLPARAESGPLAPSRPPPLPILGTPPAGGGTGSLRGWGGWVGGRGGGDPAKHRG